MDKLDIILDRVANRRYAKENPANLIKTKRDERLWKKAITQTKKRFDISSKRDFEDRHWGYAVGVFKKMKGVSENPSHENTYKIVREEIIRKTGKLPDEWGTKTRIFSIEKLQELARKRKIDRIRNGIDPDEDGAYHLDIKLSENPTYDPLNDYLKFFQLYALFDILFTEFKENLKDEFIGGFINRLIDLKLDIELEESFEKVKNFSEFEKKLVEKRITKRDNSLEIALIGGVSNIQASDAIVMEFYKNYLIFHNYNYEPEIDDGTIYIKVVWIDPDDESVKKKLDFIKKSKERMNRALRLKLVKNKK